MSTAEGWDLTVPDRDDAPPSGERERRPRLRFAGMIKDGPTDVSANMDAYLAQGFGRS